jgi:SH3 domain protein
MRNDSSGKCIGVHPVTRLPGILLICMLVATAPNALAQGAGEPGWITDKFEVTMRTAPRKGASIARLLSSGTQIQLLESPAGSDYSRVQTLGGTEGWVLNRYLLKRAPARITQPEIEQRLQKSRDKVKGLERQLRDLTAERDALNQQMGQLENSGEGLQTELEEIRGLSANAIQINDQNKQLRQRLVDNERTLDQVKAENMRLASRSNREWFVIGALVLVFGFLLGLILPRIRWRKKSNWDAF